ncbi:hypothetical protein Hanom_Chr14g01281061 [Helianthus anomalus]
MSGPSGATSEISLILTLVYSFRENNIKSDRQLIMHHVVTLIAERQNGTCTNRPLSRLLSIMSLMSKA